jgi:outer membrane protein assembly factor BamE (lipoprotein component of BamABCDE complex)
MSAAQVAEVLGSPNIVSTDENRLEVWIYDKIATDVSYSNNDGGVWLVIAGVSGSSGASSTSQRTLTIVIKFDQDKKVRDFAYHSSSF